MKRWSIPADATTAEQLVLEEVPVPEPGPGQVRIRVRALSLNARDQMVLAGPFGRTPGRGLTPLSDLAGEVDAIGAGVGGWSVGDRVTTAHVPAWQDGRPISFGPGPGSFEDPGVAAEQVVVGADSLVAAPANLDLLEASTLQVAGVTAWNALFGAHPVTAGDRVLVLGSGGVSLFAAQLARAVGAEVHAAVRGDVADPRWRATGVATVVSTTEPAWAQRFAESTGGASKVVDTVGPGLLDDCLAALAPGGEVAVPGLYDLQAPALDGTALIGKQASVRGVAVGSVAMHRSLAAFVAEHDLHPVIDRRVAFEDLPEAYTGHGTSVFGKVVVELA